MRRWDRTSQQADPRSVWVRLLKPIVMSLRAGFVAHLQVCTLRQANSHTLCHCMRHSLRFLGRLPHSTRRVELPQSEWERYAAVDPAKCYTRNLVATDRRTYTLLVLVWTPGKASAIHDHPCDGCWMRVLSGSIREFRYAPKVSGTAATTAPGQQSCGGGGDSARRAATLECVRDDVYEEGQVLYIEDCLGYHKVENPSSTALAVTMHLYSPPFDRCRVWLDETSSESSRSSWVQYDSEYGYPTQSAEHGEEALISSLGVPPPS